MTMELGGRVTIECEKNNFQAELEFKLKVAQAKAPSAPKGGGYWREVGPSHGEAPSAPQEWFLEHMRTDEGTVLGISIAQPGPREGKGFPQATQHSQERHRPFPRVGCTGLVVPLHP